MIVISGALVLVALVLLVLGLTMTDLDFVYGSIGVSLVSFVFLVIGILQRRGEPAPSTAPQVSEGTGDDDEAADKAAAAPAGRGSAQFVPAATSAPAAAKTGSAGSVPVVEDDLDDDLEPGGGPVLIVAGRPRYHVDGCRYLTGKSAEEIDVLDARDDGFTPCGVCKPDEVLEELYGEPLDDEALEDDDVLDTGVPGGGDDEPAPVAAGRRGSATLELGGSTTAGTRSRGSASVTTPAKKTPAKKVPAKKAPAQKAPAKKAAAAKAAGTTTAKKPAKQPAKKAARKATPTAPVDAPAQAVPAAASVTGGATGGAAVVVIPDRDRFHTPSCRFVRDALGTEELSRGEAASSGYRACGVCKP